MLQKKKSFKKFYKKMFTGNYFYFFFYFKWVLLKKQFEEVCYFDIFAITYPILLACFKNFIFQ